MKKPKRFQNTKNEKAASQAGDAADFSRTPGLVDLLVLEILHHAFSLLDGFFQYTLNYMFCNNVWNVVVFNEHIYCY